MATRLFGSAFSCPVEAVGVVPFGAISATVIRAFRRAAFVVKLISRFVGRRSASVKLFAPRHSFPHAPPAHKQGDFTAMQWAMYGGFSALMAYAEGFKGFQKKFSPLVVKRALTLDASAADGGAGRGRAGPLRILLAGPYSMGLFHASKKRKTVSWGLTTGVLCLVQLVKRLPYPWRSIVDAGVVVGLSYGTLSICAIWARALMGRAPSIDPALPEEKK